MKPNLVYISLPNSEHFFWAKIPDYKYNTIVDKPIVTNEKQLKELIDISKNKKVLVESTFLIIIYK